MKRILCTSKHELLKICFLTLMVLMTSAISAQTECRTDDISNGGFETGDYTDWDVMDIPTPFMIASVLCAEVSIGYGFDPISALEGSCYAYNGFDGGGPGLITTCQTVTLSALASTFNWSDDIAYDLITFGGGTMERMLEVKVDGTSLYSFSAIPQTFEAGTGWVPHSVDISAYAGQTVEICFEENIPESFTGPARIGIDDVFVLKELSCDLICPSDMILNLEAGECYEIASIAEPTLSGECNDVVTMDTVMGFTGDFDPANASLVLNDMCGGLDVSGAPASISLTSSDICGTDPVGCSGQAQENDCAFVATLISFTAPADGTFSFDWDYLNSDNVSDDNDNFGYAVGDVNTLTFGQVTQLNDGIIFVDDPAAQNGSEADIAVAAGQDIVFIIYDFSGCCGTATADITNFIFVTTTTESFEVVQTAGPANGDILEPGDYTVSFNLTGPGVDTTCSYMISINEYAGPVDTDLICQGEVNVSINADCTATIRGDDLLEGGPYMCYDDYIIEIEGFVGDVNGVPLNLPPGNDLIATITDPNTGNSCWSTLHVEYKFPPQLMCPCEPFVIDGSGVLETTDASANWGALPCVGGPGGGGMTYDVLVFTANLSGEWVAELTGLGDGYGFLFEGIFDGTCTGVTLVDEDDDGGAGLNPRVVGDLTAGTQYSLVASTFGEGLGSYEWVITAPAGACDLTCEDLDAFLADPSLGGAPTISGGCTTVEDYTFTDVVDRQLCETSTVTRTFEVTDNLGNATSCVVVYEFISTGSFDFPADLDGIDGEALQCDEYCGNVSGGWAYHYDDDYPGLRIPSPDADGNCPGSGRPGGSGCDFIQSTYWDHILPVCDLSTDNPAYWGTYKIVRHWIISNWCTGEVEEMNQLIKVEDNDPPVVTCPDDVTVGVTGHDCDRDLMRLPYPEVEDGCGHGYATPYVHTADGEEVVPGPYFDNRDRLYQAGTDWFVKDLPLGHNLAKWIATDGCNNYDTCEYYIIVEDLTPPVAVCESFRQVSLTSDGYAKIFAEAFDDGSNDNCGPVYFKVRREIIGGCDRINGDDSAAPGYQEWYDDYVKFCCEDIGEPVIVRLRVYDVDPGEGPVSSGAYAGHWNECWSEVTVEDKLPPAISCPPDMTVSCDNDLLLSDLENNDVDNPYGYAVGFDNCDVEITVRAAEPVDCGSDNRFFTRTFTARDPDGRTARCTQRIYLVEDPFRICDTESRCEPLQSLDVVCRNGGHTNRDNAEWPCDLVLDECGLGLDPWQLAANPANARDVNGNRIALNAYPRYDNAGVLNGQILGIYPYACAQIAIDSSDQVFTIVEDACLKILRTWTVIDWCQFDAITRDPDDPDRFVGYWEYIQIIKIRNTVGPTFNDLGQTDFCDESTPDCLVSVTLTAGAEDDCTPTDQLHYAWAVDYFSDGSYDLTGNGPTFSRRVPQSHPYGLGGPGTPHTIRWTVEDGCDNTTVNEYTFTAVECKKPTPYCADGIATVIMPASGCISVWAVDLDAGSFDNCTEQEDLIFTIRVANSGDPLLPSVTLCCEDIDNGISQNFEVEVCVTDEAGNTDCCFAHIDIQDTPDDDMPEGICEDRVCEITSHAITNVECDDNGTPTNPNDDTFTFEVNVDGESTAGSWVANDPNGTNGAYQTNVTFGPYPIADGDLNFTITDIEETDCFTEVAVTAPSTCSDECILSNTVSGIACNDNGTPADPMDDTYTFTVNVTSINVGGTWTANDPNNTTGAYNTNVTFGPYLIFGGSLNFMIDALDGDCSTNVVVTAPSTCSDDCIVMSNITNITCLDNDSPANPDDDTFTFDVEITGTQTGATWTANDPNNTTGAYNTAVTFGPYPIAGGALNITATGEQNVDCQISFTVTPPEACSEEMLCTTIYGLTTGSDLYGINTVTGDITFINSGNVFTGTNALAINDELGLAYFASQLTIYWMDIATGVVGEVGTISIPGTLTNGAGTFSMGSLYVGTEGAGTGQVLDIFRLALATDGKSFTSGPDNISNGLVPSIDNFGDMVIEDGSVGSETIIISARNDNTTINSIARLDVAAQTHTIISNFPGPSTAQITRDNAGTWWLFENSNNQLSNFDINTGQTSNTVDVGFSFADLGRAWCDGNMNIQAELVGNLRTEYDIPVASHAIQIRNDGEDIMASGLSKGNGDYGFNHVEDGQFVRPFKNDDTPNGITTLDLITIQRHILGLDLLSSPYQMIAADANNTQEINVLDLLELQQVILGLQSEFANNTSWRYVNRDEQMDMSNPYTFEEQMLLEDCSGANPCNADYIAVKIGDVNGTARTFPGQTNEVTARSGLNLNVQRDQIDYSEGYIRIPVTSDNFEEMDGYQFTLSFDPAQMEFVNIESGSLDIQTNNMSLKGAKEGLISTNWYDAQPQTRAADETLFTIVFKGERLSDLAINGDITEKESYRNGQVQAISLNFGSVSAGTFVLYQNVPNPFKDATLVSFDMPKEAKATLRILDVNGKLLFQDKIDARPGINEYLVQSVDINRTSGILYYQISSDIYSATKKMILLD